MEPFDQHRECKKNKNFSYIRCVTNVAEPQNSLGAGAAWAPGQPGSQSSLGARAAW